MFKEPSRSGVIPEHWRSRRPFAAKSEPLVEIAADSYGRSVHAAIVE